MRETPSLLRLLLSFSLFLLSTFILATPTATSNQHQSPVTSKRRKKPPPNSPLKRPSSWELLKGILTCKQLDRVDVHDPTKKKKKNRILPTTGSRPTKGGYAKLATCSSLCTMDDVADPHVNKRVVHRSDSSSSPEPSLTVGSGRHEHTAPLVGRRMPLRRLSGCYECRAVVDPSCYPSTRPSICSCPDCGEVFVKPDSLEAHQAVRHAVSELGQDDSGRNIVEIIFQSSWLKDSSICRVDRILRVHNAPKTIARFEGYREAVKSRVSRLNARCSADGNELLRFYCTTFACSIGTRGSTSLCGSGPCCGVCTAIRHGLGPKIDGEKGLCTTATSGKAHDCMVATNEEKAASQGRRAMLVCRVIAGRVCKRGSTIKEQEEDDRDGNVSVSQRFDSVARAVGVYSNLEELCVFDPRAILPCFVVIYRIQDPLVDYARNHVTKAGAPRLATRETKLVTSSKLTGHGQESRFTL